MGLNNRVFMIPIKLYLYLTVFVASLFCSSCASVFILNNNSSKFQPIEIIYTPSAHDSDFYHKKLDLYQKQGYIKDIQSFALDSSIGFRFQIAPESKLRLNNLLWFSNNTGKKEKKICLPDNKSEGKIECFHLIDNTFSALKKVATSKGVLFKFLGHSQYYIYLERE